MNDLQVLLLVMFTILNIFDGDSTYQALASGKGREANKVVKAIMDALGMLTGLVVVKIFAVLTIWLNYYFNGASWMLIAATSVGIGIYIPIVVRNYRINNW